MNKNIKINKDLLVNSGVFMSFMAFTFLSFVIISPIVSSNADTNTASVAVGPYTASISAETTTSIAINPTSTQAVYTGTNDITYTNTCPYGFNVTVSSKTSDTNLTRTGTDDATKTIPSTTETSLTDNTWGVSIDNGATYKPVPDVSTPTNIINTFEATTNPATLGLVYGVKTDNNLPSGRYVNDVIYTVAVKPQCLTYGIAWDLDNGNPATGVTYPTTLNFGSTVDLSVLTPTKDGYQFAGWSNGTDTFTGAETAANINSGSSPSITMTAQWTKIMAEDLEYTPPAGSNINCSDAQCMIEYLDSVLN